MDDSFFRYVFDKIATALKNLHGAKIAHRDIKPENIMITHDYKIKLIDLGFGIPMTG